jgi:hypothetical protein
MTSSAEGSDLFASYEQDFNTICDSIRNKIDKQIPSQGGGNLARATRLGGLEPNVDN